MDPLKLLLDRGLLLSDSLTSQGRFIEVSAEQTDQLGYPPGSLDGQGAELIYTADSLNALMQLFANPPADERVQDLELTLIRHFRAAPVDVQPIVLGLLRDLGKGVVVEDEQASEEAIAVDVENNVKIDRGGYVTHIGGKRIV